MGDAFLVAVSAILIVLIFGMIIVLSMYIGRCVGYLVAKKKCDYYEKKASDIVIQRWKGRLK